MGCSVLPIVALLYGQENQNGTLLGNKQYWFQPLKVGESTKSSTLFSWLTVLTNESFKLHQQLYDSNPFFRLFLLIQIQKG